jgi:5'-nucleotidase
MGSFKEQVQVNGQEWSVYSVGGSPAQTVLHGVLEVLKRKPDLVVSGINYGENVASGVTISGTVGAAMEAPRWDTGDGCVAGADSNIIYLIPRSELFGGGRICYRFARLLLENGLPGDVDLLKVDVPSDATPDTPWQLTRVSRQRYYEPMAPNETHGVTRRDWLPRSWQAGR